MAAEVRRANVILVSHGFVLLVTIVLFQLIEALDSVAGHIAHSPAPAPRSLSHSLEQSGQAWISSSLSPLTRANAGVTCAPQLLQWGIVR